MKNSDLPRVNSQHQSSHNEVKTENINADQVYQIELGDQKNQQNIQVNQSQDSYQNNKKIKNQSELASVQITTNQNINELKHFYKDENHDIHHNDIVTTNGETINKLDDSNKTPYITQILKNKLMFWFMVNHAAFTDFLLAYNMGLFNTLSDHMNYIYGWTDDEKTLQYSLINSLPQAVAAIVSLFAGGWAARFGRRRMLIILFVVALIGNAITLIANTGALLIGRIVVGLSFGGWSSIGPLYSIEIACKQYKGISGIIYSQYFGFGILTAFLVGYGLPSDAKQSATNSYWRLMYGLPIIFCLISITIFLIFFRDETAPYLYLHDKNEPKTKAVLNRVYTEAVAQDEFTDLNNFSKQASNQNVGWKQLFGPKYKSRIVLVVMLTIGFSYVGCNAINIYSYNIISESQGASTAQLFTAIMPIGDIIGPLFAMLLIEKIGRKNLYLHGLIGCMVTLVAFSITGWSNYKPLQKYLILLYKFIFATSVAPVHWIYPSEILPPVGVGFFGFAYWIASLSTVQFLPYLLNSTGAEVTIIVFPIVTFFVFIYMMIYMKETTGKNKEQIEKMFNQPSFKQYETVNQNLHSQNTLGHYKTEENK
ncbi:hypothetical protein ABPG74_017231 [Tetrahymena malaccensis]